MTTTSAKLYRPLALFFAFTVILAARLYPLIKFGASGLGYDTGFYRRQLEMAGGLLKPPSFILSQDAFSARLLLDILSWLNINTDWALFGSYLVFSILLGLTIYFLSSKLFQNKNAGLLALVIFALSPAQWLAYTFMLYKQFWAIWLLFLSFYLMESRSLFFFLPLLLALTGHRTTALLSLPALFIITILMTVKKYKTIFLLPSNEGRKGWGDDSSPDFNQKHCLLSRKFCLITAIIALIALTLWLNWPALKMLWLTWQNGLPDQDPFHLRSGIFIPRGQYIAQSFITIVAGLAGAAWLIKKRRLNAFLFFFGTALILVTVKSYFYQRLIIPLDLSFIILGGGGLWLAYTRIKDAKYSRPLLTILFLLISLNLFFTLKQYQPLINQENLRAIIQLRDLPNDSYIITFNSEYAPWLYGWAGANKRIIAPGLFWDQWNYKQWIEFWESDPIKRKTMLASYRAPLYIFNPDTDYSNDACFGKITSQTRKFICY